MFSYFRSGKKKKYEMSLGKLDCGFTSVLFCWALDYGVYISESDSKIWLIIHLRMLLCGSDKIMNVIYDKNTPQIYKVAKLQVSGLNKTCSTKNVHKIVYIKYKSYCIWSI